MASRGTAALAEASPMHKTTFMLLPADISVVVLHCPWSKPTLVTGLPNPVGPVLANSSLTIGSSFHFRASWILMHLTLPHPYHTPPHPCPCALCLQGASFF